MRAATRRGLHPACPRRNGPRLDTVLLYPVTDHDFTRPYQTHATAFPIGVAVCSGSGTTTCLTPNAAICRSRVPLRAELAGARPPTSSCRHDLRDEGVAYAERLRAAGVKASLAEYPSLTHGFFRLTGVVPAARAAVDDLIDALQLLTEDH